jgi:hypothetical protein
MENMWDTIGRYYCIDWAAVALNATSIYLLGKKLKSGWILNIGANLAWVAFGILSHSVATLVACAIFTVLSVKGWWDWQTDQTPTKPNVGDA